MIRPLILAAALTLAAAPPFAQTAFAQTAPVQAQSAWARATPNGATAGAVYLQLTSPVADALTGVSTPAAEHASVHEMSMQDNVMRMRAVEGGLTLPPGKPVTLAPGGNHIMLEGLKAPLKAGADIPLHLTFRNAPPLDVTAHVQPIGATAPQPMHMGH